jgi:hypothetical protein
VAAADAGFIEAERDLPMLSCAIHAWVLEDVIEVAADGGHGGVVGAGGAALRVWYVGLRF